MALSGREFTKTGASVFTADVSCPWCYKVASIDLGPQHKYGTVDYHCQKCGKFSSHTVKTADQWFDQHNEKLKKEKEVWKRIPPEAYVTCRRSATSGAAFVYTLYLGKKSPIEFLSRDSAEHALISEFGMSWEQANAVLTSAGMTPGQRIWLRQLTKISIALEERQLRAGKTCTFFRGATVKVNGREALFLRYSREGFAVVAFPGIGDAEVPTVELEVVDTGDSPADVGFGDEFTGDPVEEALEAETAETLSQDVLNIQDNVLDLAQHEEMEGGEQNEVQILEDAAEKLQEAVEVIQEFAGEELEEAGEVVEEFEVESDEFEPEGEEKEEKEEKKEDSEEKEAHRITAERCSMCGGSKGPGPCPRCKYTPTQKQFYGNRRTAEDRDKLQHLFNLINDPMTDPQTKQEAQRQWQILKGRGPQQPARQPLAKKLAWWYKAPWEFEHMERPDHKNQAPREKSVEEQSDLYPRENDLYPEYATSSRPKENDGALERTTQEVSDYSHENMPVYKANKSAQQKVHNAYNASGDLKKSIAFYRNDLSISDIRDLLRFYAGTGKIASHEAEALGNWFIGTKPRVLNAAKKCNQCKEGMEKGEDGWVCHGCGYKSKEALSKRQLRAVITGGPGSYHVKSEEGKNLGGPYDTRDEAKKRLQQVEYFKHKGTMDRNAVLLYFCKNCNTARSPMRDAQGREVHRATAQGQIVRYLSCKHAADINEQPIQPTWKTPKGALSKRALLDKGMGIFQPAMYRGREVLVIAIDNTGNRATVEDGQRRQFQVDVADLTPTKTGPYTGKPR